jgi:hypothetical protein
VDRPLPQAGPAHGPLDLRLRDRPADHAGRRRGRRLRPPASDRHAAQLTTQRHRRPDRHGRILVGLRCLSIDRLPCTGTLTLTAGPRRWAAGRKRFAIAPGVATRIKVTLSTRARRVVRRRGHVTLTATAVTTAPAGTFGATEGPIVVKT